MRLLIFLLLFSMNIQAQANTVDPRHPSPWYDLVYDGYYYLISDVSPAPGVSFQKGNKFEFVGVTGGGGYVPVTVFQFRANQCQWPDLETEMILVNPARGNKTDIAMEMRKNCELVFYIENRLIKTRSYFTDSTY